MSTIELLKKVQEMRLHQKKYMRTRDGRQLTVVKQIEEQVDSYIESVIREENKKRFAPDRTSELINILHGVISGKDSQDDTVKALAKIGIDLNK